MALFGSSRSPLQKVKEAQWRNDEEKLAALSLSLIHISEPTRPY